MKSRVRLQRLLWSTTIFLVLIFATSRFSGLTPYEFFGTAFWIGFVIHLIAAELWIQSTRLSATA